MIQSGRQFDVGFDAVALAQDLGVITEITCLMSHYPKRRLLAVLLLAVTLTCANSVYAQDNTAIRPHYGDQPEEITITLGVLDIVNIDNKAQVFEVDLFVEVRWLDPRLAVDSADASQFRNFALSDIWRPRLAIVNDRGLDMLLPEVATVDRQGNVVLRQRVAGPLAVDLDLREFPLDTQRLTIDVISYQYDPGELVFSDQSSMIARFDDLSEGGWVFSAVDPEMSVYRLRDNGGGTSQLRFSVMAERQASFYVITLAVPMTLILFLAWMVQWLPPDLVPARMGMASATVFSLIALGVSFRLTLPDIAYLTAADRFVLYSTLLVIASLAVTVASVRLASQERMDAAVRLTRQARWAFPLVYAGILVVLKV